MDAARGTTDSEDSHASPDPVTVTATEDTHDLGIQLTRGADLPAAFRAPGSTRGTCFPDPEGAPLP